MTRYKQNMKDEHMGKLHQILSLATIILVAPILWAQEQSSSDNDDDELVVEIQPLVDSDRYLDTLAELESWVLAESALVDLSNAMNVKDMVSPIEDFMKTMLNNLSGRFAVFGEQELGITLEATPENQVLVTSIEPEGRFHLTDLKVNDVITKINEQVAVDELDDPVATMQYYLFPYANVIRGFPPLELTVRRDEKEVDVQIKNDDEAIVTKFPLKTLKGPMGPIVMWDHDRPGAVTIEYKAPPSVFLLEIEDEMGQYFDVEFGVLILKAPKDSDFKAGDILIDIDDTAIRAIDHVTKALKRSEDDVIKAEVKRKGKKVEIELERTSVIFRNAEDQMIH
ncbi:MAG: hypothetical protein F4227_05615 [Gammaproteobacteria bacterium]|nr:hypothetical protein [Gammaproteobacteria bacterium]MYF02445.1 hypothetical protein [Gammaproteobacteria bacterium]MYI77731.1 hypothetical protein [Gammaproteobacteria bacterium]